MLIDELREKLKNIEPDINSIKTFWSTNKFDQKFDDLEKQVNEPDFWKKENRTQILKEHQNLKDLKEKYDQTIKAVQENKELLELFEKNEEELSKIKSEINELCKKVLKFKVELLLNKPEDLKNCFLSINPGAGGTESQDWASMLLRMYLRFCEREGFKVDIVDYQSGEEAGIKNATLFVKGKYSYGLLKSENGIHRLVRISPFDASKRRHTSFASVMIVPEVEEKKLQINEKDLRIDTYRAGGAGGQHVNKTDSAVRITHIPTGTVAQCQNERSQLQNKQTAMKILKAKLIKKQQREREEKEKNVEKKKIEWGSQIRSYVLHPYKMVKDLRTNYESPRPDTILDGDLMEIIEKYLVKFAGQKK
ncbi:peptide chain release factor 2 [Candidatus Babeliales bacterium]|nr:peptide chain release factor 2 [Candidatus Babeliales bacterium]